MREIFVERTQNTVRIAIKNKGRLQEVIVEEGKKGPVIGEIYKGRVKNIVLGTNAVFIDIGAGKDAYLYYSNELKQQSIKKGDEIIVEVIKEPLNEKGAKVTTNYSLPSKYLILESKGSGIEFSKRFKDDIKKELILAELKEIEDARLIVRTDAANVSLEELEHEKRILQNEYNKIKRIESFSNAVGKIYGDNLAISKVLRDKIGLEPVCIILDTEEDYNFVNDYLKQEQNVNIKFYQDCVSLFDKYDIDRELLKLRHNKIVLPCGGSIVIEKTEAMYTIDVNTGKNIKERNFEKTILDTNLEAAKEIGRQILLRNLSGIIVIDFIDPREKSHKNQIIKALKEALSDDSGNIKILPFTELNLIQISRKRRGKSSYEYMEEKCQCCRGAGRVLKLSYVEELINNEILRYSNENGITEFLIELEEIYKDKVNGDLVSFLNNIGALDKDIYINYISGIEGYRIEPLIFQNQKKNVQQYKVTII